MPQLMPLFWIISTFILLLLLLVVISLFYYKRIFTFYLGGHDTMYNMNVGFEW